MVSQEFAGSRQARSPGAGFLRRQEKRSPGPRTPTHNVTHRVEGFSTLPCPLGFDISRDGGRLNWKNPAKANFNVARWRPLAEFDPWPSSGTPAGVHRRAMPATGGREARDPRLPSSNPPGWIGLQGTTVEGWVEEKSVFVLHSFDAEVRLGVVLPGHSGICEDSSRCRWIFQGATAGRAA